MTILSTFLAIGAPQIILVVVVVLLLFGGKKIPELMRGLGSGIKEFKDASKEDEKLEEKKKDYFILNPFQIALSSPVIQGFFVFKNQLNIIFR